MQKRVTSAAFLCALLILAGPASAETDLALADAFLQNHAPEASSKLSRREKMALAKTLATPRREISDATLTKILNNPVAWENTSAGRPLLRTMIKALPRIAATPGVEDTGKLAGNPDASNFRGYGVEMISAAALQGFKTRSGRARLERMSAKVVGPDGRERESDGSAFVGADGKPRLVTIKSVSSIKAVRTSVRKAGDQLALRNVEKDGSRRPGIMMLGYDNPEVLLKLQRKDWQAAANRTGAPLLVIAVNQISGKARKIGRALPSVDAQPPQVKDRARFVPLKNTPKAYTPRKLQRVRRQRSPVF